ncbi:GntR family transcriptional regulator [Pelistega indica]|uniref:GntR family transcriptional regulator n=1 Tax=Pelistega indica TaxID=1414851 RepID=V8G2C7_9BURK|nr:LysR family transcriptional regulator [Pelistega indica]ETD70575.1 GntR family transcriptional regulator [Pelistega indica]
MNLSRFDPLTLRLFLAAASTLNLTKVAAEMHMTLSAVSKRISELEKELGCSLFVRQARGLELTAAGRGLISHAEKVLFAINRLSADMQDYALGLKGQVRLWANTSSIIQFLPKDLALFSQQHPDIHLNLEERNSIDIITALTQGRIDIGIFADNVPSPSIEKFLYRQDELVVLVPVQHPLSLKQQLNFIDVLAYDLVGLSEGASLLKRLQDASLQAQIPLKLRVQVNSFDAICRMIEAGLGIGILPLQSVPPEILGKRLIYIPLNEPWAMRTLWIGVRSLLGLTPDALSLLQFLKNTPTIK